QALGQALGDRGRTMSEADGGVPEPLPLPSAESLGGLRTSIMDASSRGLLENEEALDALGAQRWLERLNHHARRALYYLQQVDDAPAAPESAATPHALEQSAAGRMS